MAVIELLCRYTKEMSDDVRTDIKQELELQSVIQGDKFDREAESQKLVNAKLGFEYGPVCFNLRDVQSWSHVDRKHTFVEFYTKPGKTFKIHHEQFKAIYQTLLQTVVSDFTKMAELKPTQQYGGV